MAKSKTVTGKMITSFDKFKASWEKNAGEPEQTIFHYLIALLNIERDIKIADAMMSILVHKDRTLEDLMSPSGRKLGRTQRYYLMHTKENPDVPKSYLGGTPENDYKINKSRLPMTVLKIEKLKRKRGPATVKLWIQSAGKDSPTPTQLSKNKYGQWKITECSSIITGVRPSQEELEDF
ncbi:MAG: DUF6935 domain-containing protein [Promethearchaeota archaeon]